MSAFCHAAAKKALQQVTTFDYLMALPGRVDEVLPVHSLIELLETSAREPACPDFGLQLAESQGLGIPGQPALIARHSDTVAEAVNRACQRWLGQSPRRYRASRFDEYTCLGEFPAGKN